MQRLTTAAAIALLLLAMLGDCNPLLTTSPIPTANKIGNTTHGCVYQSLDCQNGGTYDSSDCTMWTADKCDTELHPEYLRVYPPCKCRAGYAGADCSAVLPPAQQPLLSKACNPDQHWDGNAVNVNLDQPKEIECFFSDEDALKFSVRLHRVVLTANFTRSTWGRVHLLFTSRHRNRSIDAGYPNYHHCFEASKDLECEMDHCYAQTIGSTATYTCHEGTCHSCGQDHPELCPPVFDPRVMQWPMVFNAHNLNPSEGTLDMGLKTQLFALAFQCRTGACSSQPINTNYTPSVSKQWMVYLMSGVGAGLLVFIIGGSIWSSKWRSKVMQNEKSAQAARQQLQLIESTAVAPNFGLAWHQVLYGIRAGQSFRVILRGIFGYVEPKQLVAMMGSSGAGKSSLMDILAGRDKSGIVTGGVSLVCFSHACQSRDRVVSYVPQDDHLLHTQTVREALLFSARTRLPPSFSEPAIQAKVAQVLNDLRIAHIAESRIGHPDAGGGISGGERKRVAIGVELVANPRMLLLDEPTSGLDSFSAHVVIQVLRETADRGCACILTIHQPPSAVYKMFDSVLLLCRNGHQAYYGPPLDAIDHFREALGYRDPDRLTNPAEHVLDIISTHDEVELQRISRAFFASKHFAKLQECMRRDMMTGAVPLHMGETDLDGETTLGIAVAPPDQNLEEMDVGSPLLDVVGVSAAGMSDAFAAEDRTVSARTDEQKEPPVFDHQVRTFYSRSVDSTGFEQAAVTHSHRMPVYKRHRRSMVL